MVKYYLVINEAVEKPYLIGRFTEVITVDGKRQLSVTLYHQNLAEGDSILVTLAKFQKENSITKIAIKDSTNKTIYESTNYTRLNSCAATLHNMTDPGDDFTGMEYAIGAESDLT